MRLARVLRHFKRPPWWYQRLFAAGTLWAIEVAIRHAESRHRGELRFVAEGILPWRHLWNDIYPRERAAELFAELCVWDTEDNCGILIYVQLADRRVEILADRGIAARVPQAEWDALCRRMEEAFGRGEWRDGALVGIEGAADLIARHFPAIGPNPNELPDKPLVL